ERDARVLWQARVVDDVRSTGDLHQLSEIRAPAHGHDVAEGARTPFHDEQDLRARMTFGRVTHPRQPLLDIGHERTATFRNPGGRRDRGDRRVYAVQAGIAVDRDEAEAHRRQA